MTSATTPRIERHASTNAMVRVALVVFAAKTSGLASAASRPGLWFFAVSAVLTAVLAKIADRKAA